MDNVSTDYKGYHIMLGKNEYNESGIVIKDSKGKYVKPSHLEGDIGLFNTEEDAKKYIDYIVELQSKWPINNQKQNKSLYEVTGKKSMLAKNIPDDYTGNAYVLKDHIHGFYEGEITDIRDERIHVYTSASYAEDRNNFRKIAPGSYNVVRVKIKNGKIVI